MSSKNSISSCPLPQLGSGSAPTERGSVRTVYLPLVGGPDAGSGEKREGEEAVGQHEVYVEPAQDGCHGGVGGVTAPHPHPRAPRPHPRKVLLEGHHHKLVQEGQVVA